VTLGGWLARRAGTPARSGRTEPLRRRQNPQCWVPTTGDGQVLVSLRDVMANFMVELRPPIDRDLRAGEPGDAAGADRRARDYFSSYASSAGRVRAAREHVATMRRNLVFEFPKDGPGRLAATRLGPVVEALQIATSGQFTVKAQVHW